MMDTLEKEFDSRKEEIIKEIELLFKTNMKITDWDIPENDDTKAAHILLSIFDEALAKIKEDVKNGKYSNY